MAGRNARGVRRVVSPHLRLSRGEPAADRRRGRGGSGRHRCRRDPCDCPRTRRRCGVANRSRDVARRRLAARSTASSRRGPARHDIDRARPHRRGRLNELHRAGMVGLARRRRQSRAAAGRGEGTRPGGRNTRSNPSRSDERTLHACRRADGRRAPADGQLGKHQGAPRLFLRDLRRAGSAGCERTPHAGAPGLDGR